MDFDNFGNKPNWDDDGDGDVDIDDILGAFDTDGDGVLGADELQKLAEQLSSQVFNIILPILSLVTFFLFRWNIIICFLSNLELWKKSS